MIPGDYIVEAATPPGFKPLREHHQNVDFGDEFVPALRRPCRRSAWVTRTRCRRTWP